MGSSTHPRQSSCMSLAPPKKNSLCPPLHPPMSPYTSPCPPTSPCPLSPPHVPNLSVPPYLSMPPITSPWPLLPPHAPRHLPVPPTTSPCPPLPHTPPPRALSAFTSVSPSPTSRWQPGLRHKCHRTRRRCRDRAGAVRSPHAPKVPLWVPKSWGPPPKAPNTCSGPSVSPSCVTIPGQGMPRLGGAALSPSS